MNRTSWIIIIATLAIVVAAGFFFIWPQANSSWKLYKQELQAKKDLEDVSKRKEVLAQLSKTNQLANLYDIASKYIPEEANSGDLVIQLTAMANGANLTVDQISLETETKAKTTTEADTTTNKTNSTNSQTTATSNPSDVQEVGFSLKVSGTFADFLNFLKSVETSSRLVSIYAMNLAQTQDKFTADIKGKAYWEKSVSLEKNLANISIPQETINKFQNLKTYGNPINLPTESGFGRPDPFAGF